MKTNNTPIDIAWKAEPHSWLLRLFITRRWWPHILFISCGCIADIAAGFFYTGYAKGIWYDFFFKFIAYVYFGRLIGNVLLRGLLLRSALAFIFYWMPFSLDRYMTLYHYNNINFYHSEVLTMIAVSPVPFIALSLGIFLKLLRHTVRQQFTEASQRKSELDLLLSQLSPHFLFNTLNNLYGLSLSQHKRMPELILKLSDLLRYSVYDAKQRFVPLKTELAYINNYIELSATSVGDRLILKTDIVPVHDPDIRIAPMLLIVFVENAFKHSQNSTAANIYIDIHLAVTEHHIIFTVENSYDKKEGVNDKHGGMGIANSMKRLELLYDQAYEYQQEKKPGFYTVTLTLNRIRPT